MKLKNLGYIKLLSVIMTLLMLVSFIPAAAVNDDGGLNSQTSETGTDSHESSAKADNAAELETESFSIEFEVEEDKGSSGLGTAGDAGDQTRLPPTALADGVYMLENLYHTGYYMSVRGASLDAGARIVPRQYSSGTPISTFDRQALFKISKVPGTTRYVIRSMLNNGIGLGIVNGKVVTKELPFDDADVSANDTFTITGLPTSGYQINPYVGGGMLAAELGTMSDDPSVGAYVVQGNASTVGNRGKWTLTAYTGVEKYGFDYFRTAGMGDGLVKGYTYYMWPKSWSTVIGANTPCVTVDSTYTDDIVTFAWNEDELCATFTGEKCDDFQINMEIRVGDAQTATNTITRGYTVIPDIVEKTAYIRNVATDKYMEVENGTTAEGGIVQQRGFEAVRYMQWLFELDGDGFFRIKSLKSGKYLGANSSNTSEVRQYGTVTDYLRWKIVETSSGNYRLVCKASTWRKSVLAAPATTSGDGVDLTIQTTYTDDSSYNDEWGFDNNIIYYVNYYDSTFAGNTAMINAIETANSFSSYVYSKYYNLDVIMDGVAIQRETVIDLCEVPFDLGCNNEMCGSDCNVNHHKNGLVISNELFNSPREDNHVYVLWTNRNYGIYCHEDKDSGTHTSADWIAVVYGFRPVIHFMTISGNTNVQLACMTTVLVHETAHVLNMPDVSDNPGHDSADSTECVMEPFDSDDAYWFYLQILLGAKDPFCASCDAAMKGNTSNINIPGN